MSGLARAVIICGLMIGHAGAAPEPLAETQPDPSAHPIFGAWEITRFDIAPWVDKAEDRKDLEADGAGRLELRIEFAPDEVISKDAILGCTAAHYQPTNYPAEAIFQGSLPEPDQETLAAGLGFPQGDIPGFDLDCSTGLFSYHFANADTLLFALSDVVYWLTRRK